MNNNIVPFNFEGEQVRATTINDEPWFMAVDVCRVLEIGNASQALTRLDDDEVTLISNEGRQSNVISESGLYSLIFGSRKAIAKDFQRWVKREVLPQIRKTGAYSTQPTLTGPALLAAALIEAQATLETHRQQVLQLEPRAQAWDSFLGSTGDYSVNEAAKILARDKNIHFGENRLRAQLEEWRWIYRHSGKPRAMQTQIDNGCLTEKASFYYHPETGEKVAKTPQVRITPKGLDAIAKRMHEVAA